MWRHLLQRLGIGYLLLLPALIALGCALDAAIAAFCYHMHFPLEQMTGRGISDQQGALRLMAWTWKNPGCVVIAVMLPWWIGAWALVAAKSVPRHRFVSQMVMGVLSTVVAQLAFFVFCAAVLVRELQRWAHAHTGYGIWLFLAVLLFVASLVLLKGAKLVKK